MTPAPATAIERPSVSMAAEDCTLLATENCTFADVVGAVLTAIPLDADNETMITGTAVFAGRAP